MTRGSRSVSLSICLAAALVPSVLHGAERYDPRLRFLEIRTAHFTIYFHQGEEALARRLAVLAEEVHVDLSDRFDAEAGARHTHVILVDQHDEANGWATPLPYNVIEITAAAPSPSSLIGYTDDWLRLVFAHEYTHVLHLDRSRGLFRGLRRLFGRSPVAFPNIFVPAWNVEGLATAMETGETGQGRLAAGEFRVIVDASARAGRFEPPGRVAGGLVAWPGGHAAYAFGARFHEFLAERYGAGKLTELADVTSGRVPFFSAGAYPDVFGRGLRALWSEFEDSVSQAAASGPAPTATGLSRLTAQGFVVAGPRWTPDGRSIVFSSRDPHGFPALMEVPADGGSPRRLGDRYLGERASVGDRVIVFDQYQYVRSVGLQADLYRMTRDSNEVVRLTREARASDPDLRRQDHAIVAVVRNEGRADLVRYDFAAAGARPPGESVVLASEPETQHAAPRWSPDGTRVAAERRRLGQGADVVVIDASTRQTTARIVADEGRVGEPEWTPDGRALVVSWERPPEPFNLYHVDLETGTARVLVRQPGGARAGAVSPDGRRVAFVGYTTAGYDLFTASLHPDTAPVEGLTVVRHEPLPAPEPAASDGAATTYNPLPTLVPRFWIPVVATDEERLEVGAATLGVDVLGRHAYTAAATWSDRAVPDWNVTYAYDRWRPTLFLSAGDDAFEWQGLGYRETTFDAGAVLRFRTVRRAQTILGAVHVTREDAPEGVFDRRSIRAAYRYSTARRFGYSIGPEEGASATFALDVSERAFGADASGGTMTADLRVYPRLGGRHRVLALRAAAGASWGDEETRRVLGAGGSAAPAAISFGRGAVGLARGFSTDAIAGSRAVVLNVDYRVPLLTVERGPDAWPVFLRRLHGAVFIDAAHAWDGTFDLAGVRLSGGAEIAFDVVVGHYLPLTVAGGLAARRDPARVQSGAAAYARVGYAF